MGSFLLKEQPGAIQVHVVFVTPVKSLMMASSEEDVSILDMDIGYRIIYRG